METVILGEDIPINIFFVDGDGAPYDPDSVQVDIMRNASQTIFDPFTYENGTVDRVATGQYRKTLTIPTYMTPGIYTARWTSVLDDESTVVLQYFQVEEATEDPSGILDPPRIYGTIRESFQYTDLGLSITDRIFLIGHANGIPLNSPMQVINMQESINLLAADTDSPLLRGLLEVYNAGARDIWLMAAAPMSEYVPDLTDRLVARDEWGGLTFYERYQERLDTTYSILLDWDYPEIIVPLEAPFYYTGEADFLTQLADHCVDAFVATGSPRIGIIGTRIASWTADDIAAMAADERLTALEASAKFVVIVQGEGTVILPQMPTGYTASMSTAAAASLTTRRIDMGITYAHMPNAASLIGRDLTKTEIATLAQARINPCIRTQKGKRGQPFQVVLATDNTLSADGSDYWAVAQLRIVCKCLNQIRALGRRALGTVGYPIFKQDVNKYLSGLVRQGMIKDFKLDIERDPVNQELVYVDAAVMPYIGVRELFFTVEVGPGV